MLCQNRQLCDCFKEEEEKKNREEVVVCIHAVQRETSCFGHMSCPVCQYVKEEKTLYGGLNLTFLLLE